MVIGRLKLLENAFIGPVHSNERAREVFKCIFLPKSNREPTVTTFSLYFSILYGFLMVVRLLFCIVQLEVVF